MSTVFVVVWSTDRSGKQHRGAYSTRKSATKAAEARTRDDDNDYDIHEMPLSALTSEELAYIDGIVREKTARAPPRILDNWNGSSVDGGAAASKDIAIAVTTVTTATAETEDVDLIMAQTGAPRENVESVLKKYNGDSTRALTELSLEFD